jgi:hypothetical protein
MKNVKDPNNSLSSHYKADLDRLKRLLDGYNPNTEI